MFQKYYLSQKHPKDKERQTNAYESANSASLLNIYRLDSCQERMHGQ
jgi:hypothetical protein